MYINDGYGHFVITFLDMNQAENALAHELAHRSFPTCRGFSG